MSFAVVVSANSEAYEIPYWTQCTRVSEFGTIYITANYGQSSISFSYGISTQSYEQGTSCKVQQLTNVQVTTYVSHSGTVAVPDSINSKYSTGTYTVTIYEQSCYFVGKTYICDPPYLYYLAYNDIIHVSVCATYGGIYTHCGSESFPVTN